MSDQPPTSNKPLDTNFKPPEPLIFFIDRALGKNIIANALREAGETVYVHDDWFAQDELDTDWLRVAGEKSWIVLTKDAKIRYRTLERNSLLAANVRAFVFVSGNISGAETAQIFIKALPAIKRFVAENEPPFIVKIYKDASIKQMDLSEDS